MSDKQPTTIEASNEGQAEFGQANRAVELAQARAEAAMAAFRLAESQRQNALLREMASQGLKTAEWNPTVTPAGVLTFVKVEQEAAASGQ